MARLTLIAAVARDGAIGRAGGMPWHLPADLAHFKRITQGHPVVMGRKTWDSLPPRFRPLPGRRNVVVTRQAGWRAAGAEQAASLDDALGRFAADEAVFVIGGGQLYEQALSKAKRLVLTEVQTTVPDADTHFPAWDRAAFREVSRESHADQVPAYDFVHYERLPR